MDKAKIEIFKDRVIRGTIALTTRTFLNQLISFAGNFILTIILSPAVFGIFFVVTAVISFLNYFSDIGLAAALVQKKEEPKRAELVSVFTLQEAIVLFIIAVSLLISSKIAIFYKLSSDGIFLYKALLFSFFLASLKTIPSILLERKLNFSKLVFPQVLENIIFYLTAVFMALNKMDILSFAYASIFRGIIGVIAIYWVSPWLPGIGFSYRKVKKLINFGIPFQVNSLLALVKDDLLTLYLGKILPFESLGLLGWAKKQAEVPLRLIMDSVIRVTFPAFSRIQHEKSYMTKAINKSIFFLATFILPVSFLLIIYIKPLVFLIPKYLKWMPALTAFYLFAVSAIFSAFSSTFVNALNALGLIKKTLFLMIFWTVLTWVLIPFLTHLIGLNGWPAGSLIISFFIFVPVLMLKKYAEFSFLSNIIKPLIITLVMSFFSIITLPLVSNLLTLAFFIFASLLVYAGMSWKFLKSEINILLPARFKKA